MYFDHLPDSLVEIAMNLSINQISKLFNLLPINPDSARTQIETVSTNSKNIPQNCLFVALKGEKFDAHDFLEEAKQANALILEKNIFEIKTEKYKNFVLANLKNIFFVDDSLTALQQLAKFYLSTKNLTKIAITGSVGKTTTKDVLFNTSKFFFNSIATKGNLNNHIGLPLSIFEISDDNELCILEMGINQPHEMQNLADIVKPNIGIITNIGNSHLKYLKDKGGVLNAKWQLVDKIKKNGFLLVNGDDEKLNKKAVEEKENLLTKNVKIIKVGHSKNNDFFGEIVNFENDMQTLKIYEKSSIKSSTFDFKILGEAGFYSAIFCFAVLRCLNIDGKKIAEALANFCERSSKRFERKIIGNVEVINDAYNANPDSMNEALLVFEKLKSKNKKIAILGDMLELGDDSEIEHRKLARLLSQISLDFIFLHGENCLFTLNELQKLQNKKNFFWSNNKDVLATEIKKNLKPNDLILLKASRGMKLELVEELLFRKD